MRSGSVKVALRSLRAHRLRSALTMLGIIIGVAAVVVMVAVGSGARDRITAQIRSLQANLISINPGSALMKSVRLGSGAAPRLSEDDALAIELEIPGVLVTAPLLYARAQFTVGASNWAGSIRGVTPGYFTAREWGVTAGREMTPEDNSRAAKVVLLGTTMLEKLFGDTDPIDTTVRIRDVPFTVIGLLDRKGQSVWGDDQDDVALVPLTTRGSNLSESVARARGWCTTLPLSSRKACRRRTRWRRSAICCASATGCSPTKKKPSSSETSPRRRMSKKRPRARCRCCSRPWPRCRSSWAASGS
jgi:hypothetical protein